MSNACRVLAFASAMFSLTGIAHAQATVAELYKDKTVTIIVGVSAGAGVDLFARILARHFGAYLPGHPKFVVTNIVGAGSKIAAKTLYSIAPKDGTTIGTVLSGALMEPLRSEAIRKDYDPTRFNYIGNGTTEALVTVVRTDGPVQSLQDMFVKELVIGTPGGGSSVHETAMIYKNLLGAKLRIVTGYPGVREVGLAVEKGEVQGMMGMPFSTARKFFPGYLTGAQGFKVIAQDDPNGHDELNRAGVPLSITAAKPGPDRDALELYQAQAVLLRVYLMPPGVPADRVEAMRKGFLEVVRSPEFQADFEKANGDPAKPESGEDVLELITKLYASPPELIARIAKAVEN